MIGSLDVGGTETQVCRLAVELSTLGHEVLVFVLTDGGPLKEILDSHGVPWKALGYGGIRFRNADRKLRPWVVLGELAKIRDLYVAFRGFRPDVCHAFLYWAYVIALPIAAAARVPVRVSGRRGLTRPRGGSRLYRSMESFSNRFAHAITANADAVTEDVIEHEGVARSRIRVIRNGVDIPEHAAPVDEEPAVGLIVANLIAYKGHGDLISAMSMMTNPPKIRVIGQGLQREFLESEIERAGLTGTLILEGHRQNASSEWTKVQFGVLASHEEGFPNALLEGMAAGVPMVATRVGGVPELLEDGVTGIIVPAQDPREMASAISRLVEDKDLRLKLGTAARASAMRYSWEMCVDEHVSLYKEIASGLQRN